MVLEEFDGRFRKKNMNPAFDRIERDRVVSWVRCEDGNRITRLELVNCSLIGIWVLLVVGGKGVEGGLETIVNLCNVLVEVLACLWHRRLLDYTDKEARFEANDVRIAGNLVPLTPTMLRLLTLPRRRKSNRVRPTTPTFLSEADAAPSTKPVVYSPVPT